MSSRNRYAKAIEQAAGAAPPVPDASEVYQTTMPPIPRKGERAYEYTDNGLVIRRELTEKDWHTIHSEIRAVTGSSRALNIGDAALYGFERNLITTFEEAAELFKAPADSIKIYVSICRNVPQLIRVNSLTFKHYRYIAPLPDDEKQHWIQFAAAYNISSGNLKALIDQVNPPQLPTETSPADSEQDEPDDDRPALSDEMEAMQEATPIPDIAIKEVKKQLRYFVHCVETDTLQEMRLDDLYLLKLYIDDKFNQRRKMGV